MKDYYVYERQPEGNKEKLVLLHRGTHQQCSAFIGRRVADKQPTHNLVTSLLEHKAAEKHYCI